MAAPRVASEREGNQREGACPLERLRLAWVCGCVLGRREFWGYVRVLLPTIFFFMEKGISSSSESFDVTCLLLHRRLRSPASEACRTRFWDSGYGVLSPDAASWVNL